MAKKKAADPTDNGDPTTIEYVVRYQRWLRELIRKSAGHENSSLRIELTDGDTKPQFSKGGMQFIDDKGNLVNDPYTHIQSGRGAVRRVKFPKCILVGRQWVSAIIGGSTEVGKDDVLQLE